MFNPAPRIESLPVGAQGQCLVIDDALSDPAWWVELAAEHRDRFATPVHNAYPGIELRLPDALSARLDAFFARHVRERLGARRTLRMYSRLSLVTRSPESLAPTQWICHRDRMELEPGRSVAACVLYLFDDPALGGTSFFLPRRSPRETAQLVHDSGALTANDFTARYGLHAGYPVHSNDWFEKVLTVPPRFNRLIFYDGMLFHAGDITAAEKLDADPRRGRLTLNGFFTCRRRVE
jgi:hypothetical protein